MSDDQEPTVEERLEDVRLCVICAWPIDAHNRERRRRCVKRFKHYQNDLVKKLDQLTAEGGESW
jgi:hypothetical protein